jgi:hypothetical protein
MAGNLNCRGGRIPEILGRIMRTGGEELVKFLQDVLDALFAIFSTEDGNSTPHSGLVFHALGKQTLFYLILAFDTINTSVGDPDPEPDPHVFGPPGSGSISQRCGSGFGSGSFPFIINLLSEMK